jgi:hypothetical protein
MDGGRTHGALRPEAPDEGLEPVGFPHLFHLSNYKQIQLADISERD